MVKKPSNKQFLNISLYFKIIPVCPSLNTVEHPILRRAVSQQAEVLLLLVHFLRAAKRATANARRSSCQQAYSTQHKTQLPEFLLQPHWTLRRLRAASGPGQPPVCLRLPPYLTMLSSHLIKTCCFSQVDAYFVFPNCKTRRDYLVFEVMLLLIQQAFFWSEIITVICGLDEERRWMISHSASEMRTVNVAAMFHVAAVLETLGRFHMSLSSPLASTGHPFVASLKCKFSLSCLRCFYLNSCCNYYYFPFTGQIRVEIYPV